MNKRYDNLIGQALGQGVAVFGADGMVAASPNGMMGGNCWGDPAQIDPSFQQRRMFSGVLGAQCGPLLQQQYLPFEDVGCIGNCEEVIIRAFPQNWGKLVRFIIPRSQASSFVVTDARVGITPLFAGNGIIPAEAMEPEAEGVIMSTVTYFPNQPVSITLRNISGGVAYCNPTAIVMAVSGGFPQLFGTPLS